MPVTSVYWSRELLSSISPSLCRSNATPPFSPHAKFSLNRNENALAAFKATKEVLANASLLSYRKDDALMTDASDTAVGAVLQQYVNDTWHPISFFSRKMTPAEIHYSTFDRELLAVYLAIKYFCHFLEGRHFHVLTDHKPLTFALNTRPDRHSSRQTRQLDYISQFTSTIRHGDTLCLTPFMVYLIQKSEPPRNLSLLVLYGLASMPMSAAGLAPACSVNMPRFNDTSPPHLHPSQLVLTSSTLTWLDHCHYHTDTLIC